MRVLCLVPPPQETLQAPQLTHDDHFPSTAEARSTITAWRQLTDALVLVVLVPGILTGTRSLLAHLRLGVRALALRPVERRRRVVAQSDPGLDALTAGLRARTPRQPRAPVTSHWMSRKGE